MIKQAGKPTAQGETAFRRAAVLVALAGSCVSCAGTDPAREAVDEESQAITSVGSLTALDNMRKDLGGNYRLTANITMRSSDPAFVPIGSPFSPFHGTFDGNGFTITNLRIGTGSPRWYTGLFGAVDGATLKKVRLNNVNVVGLGETGAIVGNMSNSTLTDSYVTGTVTGQETSVGMAVGFVGEFSDIERCYATGTVGGTTPEIGGFIGKVSVVGFDDQFNNGPLAKIKEIFTNVNVNPTIPSGPGDVIAGGLIGFVEGAKIEDINAVGPVRGRGKVGGILGYVVNDDPNTQATDFQDGLSRGNVTDASGANPAGPIGVISGPFFRCDAFYDLKTDSGTAIATGDTFCNAGFSDGDLRAPHPGSNPLMYPFTIGQPVTQADIQNGALPCKLGSGSDRDWGFGTCGEPQTWALNSSSQHITLTRIPNPSVQPK
jgi:hypothetical protein